MTTSQIQQIIDAIINGFKSVGGAVGNGVTYGFQQLVHQQIVNGWLSIGWGAALTLFLFLPLLTTAIVALRRSLRGKNMDGTDAICFVISGVVLVIILGLVTDGIGDLLNPQANVINHIVNCAQPSGC